MEGYLSYFDILGFKKFIETKEDSVIQFEMDNLLRESQLAVSNSNVTSNAFGGKIPDIHNSKVNCLHVSDSIIFWTNDSTKGSFLNILNASSIFLTRCCVNNTFPVRGCLVKGGIHFSPFTLNNKNCSTFINSSLYGKALIDAYSNAESQDWVGCYIDGSALAKIKKPLIDQLVAQGKLVKYPVPFKVGPRVEYCFKLYREGMNNMNIQSINSLFHYNVKRESLTEGQEMKLKNTLEFFNYTKCNDA